MGLNKVKRYILNIILSLDQMGNSILFGDPDETISSRIGRIKVKWGGQIPRWRFFTRWTDWVLNRIDPGHSIDAIEPDEGKDGLVDKPGPDPQHKTYFENAEGRALCHDHALKEGDRAAHYHAMEVGDEAIECEICNEEEHGTKET